MRRLSVLALLLTAAFAVWLVRGLPQTARLERAWQDLLARERALQAALREIEPVDYGEFVALSRRHEQAASRLEHRRAALTGGEARDPAHALAALLEQTRLAGLRRPSPLAERLLHDAAASSGAEASLTAIVGALPDTDGLEVEELLLREDGRPHELGVPAGLQEVEAQLVVTGALADVLGALERLAPERGSGLPLLTLRSASLRRIEPERWGSEVRRLSAPPVRLSATLGVLVAAQGAAP